jgi:hypothetical protein
LAEEYEPFAISNNYGNCLNKIAAGEWMARHDQRLAKIALEVTDRSGVINGR